MQNAFLKTFSGPLLMHMSSIANMHKYTTIKKHLHTHSTIKKPNIWEKQNHLNFLLQIYNYKLIMLVQWVEQYHLSKLFTTYFPEPINVLL